jgi:hypothetical protein
MRRLKILTRTLLIFSIIDFVLAAPVAVRERPKIVTAASQKRGDPLDWEWSPNVHGSDPTPTSSPDWSDILSQIPHVDSPTLPSDSLDWGSLNVHGSDHIPPSNLDWSDILSQIPHVDSPTLPSGSLDWGVSPNVHGSDHTPPFRPELTNILSQIPHADSPPLPSDSMDWGVSPNVHGSDHIPPPSPELTNILSQIPHADSPSPPWGSTNVPRPVYAPPSRTRPPGGLGLVYAPPSRGWPSSSWRRPIAPRPRPTWPRPIAPWPPSGWPPNARPPSGWPPNVRPPSGWPPNARPPSGWPPNARPPSGWPPNARLPGAQPPSPDSTGLPEKLRTALQAARQQYINNGLPSPQRPGSSTGNVPPEPPTRSQLRVGSMPVTGSLTRPPPSTHASQPGPSVDHFPTPSGFLANPDTSSSTGNMPSPGVNPETHSAPNSETLPPGFWDDIWKDIPSEFRDDFSKDKIKRRISGSDAVHLAREDPRSTNILTSMISHHLTVFNS